MDLSPIKASPPTSPFSNASAKENISSFNRLASVAISVNKKKNLTNNENRDGNKANFKATTNNNINPSTRRPFGALSSRDNIPSSVVSTLAKKPSGNSNGGKALKVLGASQNVDKARSRGKESTSVKDRVKEWERERERLREMARLEEMQRESDDFYEKKKKERVTEKAKKVKVVDSEKNRKENSEEEGEEEEKKIGNGLEEEIEKEGPSAKKDLSTSALEVVDPTNEWDWDKENTDFSATSPMFCSSPPLTQGLFTSLHAIIAIVTISNTIPVTTIMSDTPPSTRTNKETNKNIFKHSIKASIGNYLSSIFQALEKT